MINSAKISVQSHQFLHHVICEQRPDINDIRLLCLIVPHYLHSHTGEGAALVRTLPPPAGYRTNIFKRWVNAKKPRTHKFLQLCKSKSCIVPFNFKPVIHNNSCFSGTVTLTTISSFGIFLWQHCHKFVTCVMMPIYSSRIIKFPWICVSRHFSTVDMASVGLLEANLEE